MSSDSTPEGPSATLPGSNADEDLIELTTGLRQIELEPARVANPDPRQSSNSSTGMRIALSVPTTNESIANCLLQSPPRAGEVDCPICRDDYALDNRKVVQATCTHTFHESCLLKWFVSDAPNYNTCPFCRLTLFRPVNWVIKQLEETQPQLAALCFEVASEVLPSFWERNANRCFVTLMRDTVTAVIRRLEDLPVQHSLSKPALELYIQVRFLQRAAWMMYDHQWLDVLREHRRMFGLQGHLTYGEQFQCIAPAPMCRCWTIEKRFEDPQMRGVFSWIERDRAGKVTRTSWEETDYDAGATEMDFNVCGGARMIVVDVSEQAAGISRFYMDVLQDPPTTITDVQLLPDEGQMVFTDTRGFTTQVVLLPGILVTGADLPT